MIPLVEMVSSDAVHEATENAESTNDMVAGLSGVSEPIIYVTQLISGIASQTDFLALNAIEVAWAGMVGW